MSLTFIFFISASLLFCFISSVKVCPLLLFKHNKAGLAAQLLDLFIIISFLNKNTLKSVFLHFSYNSLNFCRFYRRVVTKSLFTFFLKYWLGTYQKKL